MEQANFLILL